MAAPSVASSRPAAHLSARIFAYLVDSVVLLAFILVFFALAGGVLLISANRSGGDPSDVAFSTTIALFSGGTLLSWTAFNLALMLWRGQTSGMYVLGIKVVGDEKYALTPGQALVRWAGLHPLLFHPLLLLPWSILTLLSVDFALTFGMAIVLAIVFLSIASPIVSVVAAITDRDGRALHDRLAHTLVIHMEQP